MYYPLRRTLMALRDAFDRAARRFGPLNVERLVAPSGLPDRQITVEGWQSFVARHGSESTAGWQRWLVAPDASKLVRVWGDQAGLDTFERLAESSYLAITEFNPAFPEFASYQGWIEFVLFNFAEGRPSALLRSSTRFWTSGPQPGAEEIEQLEWHWATGADGCFLFPTHPFCDFLAHDLFTSSIAAIDQLLDPEAILIVGSVTDDLLEAREGQPVVEFDNWIALEVAQGAGRQKKTDIHEDITARGQSVLSVESDTATSIQSNLCMFKKMEHGWQIQFVVAGIAEGPVVFEDKEGFAEWKLLLENPGKLTEALGIDPDDRVEVGRPDKAFDADSLKRVLEELRQLEDDRDIAETTGNAARASELTERIEELQAHLDRDTDRFNRSYDLGSASKPERARKRVGARLRRTREERIRPHMPHLADFLKDTLRASGTSFAYEPDRHPLGGQVHWHI